MSSLTEPLPVPRQRILDRLRRHSNVVMFAAGFLFDFVTIRRIDAWTDLSIQMLYLAAGTCQRL